MTEKKDSDLSNVPPGVVYLFQKLTWQLVNRGFAHYSARAIMHRIRWHHEVDKGEKDFKCNNNWTPQLSRWFMNKHPELDGFFETRASPSRHNMTDYGGPYE
jgi:hypothetical protein